MINGDVPRSIRYMLDRSGNREVEELGPISPNGRWLVLTERRTAVDNNLYLYDIKNHRAIDVTTHKGMSGTWPRVSRRTRTTWCISVA